MVDRIWVALTSPAWLRRGIDFILAAILWQIPPAIRRIIFAGTAHACPLCQNKLRSFVTLNRPSFHWCPVCRSLPRHRLVWLFFQQRVIARHTIQRLLHIAPEQALASTFQQLTQQVYVSADLYDPQAHMRTRLEALPYLDQSFDLLFCSHVLEHIPDDQRAMHEIWRVLRPGGIAIVIVPLLGEQTYEDATITDPQERERAFGQFDHVRWYGLDITTRLTAAGFHVEQIDISNIVHADQITHYGLIDEGPIMLCVRQSTHPLRPGVR
jgi:Methyltransferase domain